MLFLFLILSSILIGLVNGLLGGGGGLLCVPMLKAIFKLDDKHAHATSIFITAIISIPTLVVYITAMSMNFAQMLFISFGVLLGGILGSNMLKKISNDFLNVFSMGGLIDFSFFNYRICFRFFERVRAWRRHNINTTPHEPF